eukprot:CAMPEP_0197893236 /NCGR_PEP_ID=MMETSP1439-20131203/32648_1 /TAXON_ID=66791 /ORGANISM="Gonyaulax spinifera, Strain CCMP409" /LENGTH=294 /DNA_ID=CAMNT_0043513495 /DNA_START=318 /DNA_END=1203 /DNA_ORIENTATION=-
MLTCLARHPSSWSEHRDHEGRHLQERVAPEEPGSVPRPVHAAADGAEQDVVAQPDATGACGPSATPGHGRLVECEALRAGCVDPQPHVSKDQRNVDEYRNVPHRQRLVQLQHRRLEDGQHDRQDSCPTAPTVPRLHHPRPTQGTSDHLVRREDRPERAKEGMSADEQVPLRAEVQDGCSHILKVRGCHGVKMPPASNEPDDVSWHEAQNADERRHPSGEAIKAPATAHACLTRLLRALHGLSPLLELLLLLSCHCTRSPSAPEDVRKHGLRSCLHREGEARRLQLVQPRDCGWS